MRSLRLSLALALVLGASLSVRAFAASDEEKPTQTTSGGAPLELASAPSGPVGPTSLPLSLPGPSSSRTHDSAAAGSLKGIQAVSTSEGQARLLLNGRTLSVRPGDVIGSDLVHTISPNRIVLSRPSTTGAGEAIVVVSFDSRGRARVRVYAQADATTAPPPQGR